LPPKILLDSKVVKIDPKIIILLCSSKSVTHSGADKKLILRFRDKHFKYKDLKL